MLFTIHRETRFVLADVKPYKMSEYQSVQLHTNCLYVLNETKVLLISRFREIVRKLVSISITPLQTLMGEMSHEALSIWLHEP